MDDHFLSGPFLDIAALTGSQFQIATTFTTHFLVSTGWDRMLSNSNAEIAYRAELSPWALTDRS